MISCNPQPPEAWSLSISGNEDDAITVNTSLGRYVVSGNTLLLNNVNEMDEGLYRCVYHRSTVRHTCIYIYGECVIPFHALVVLFVAVYCWLSTTCAN